MRMTPKRLAAISLLPMALAALAGWTAWLQSRRADQELAQRTALQAELSRLKSAAEALERDNQALRVRLEQLGEPTPPPVVAAVPQGAASNLEQARLLVKTQSELAAANQTVTALQARLEELQQSLGRAEEENQRLATSLRELQEKWQGTSRLVSALETELKTKNDRLAQVEATSLLLHKQNREAEDRLSEIRRLLRELDDLNRRRENLLANLLRRYRELNDLLRTATLRPEGAGEGRPADPAELSRLQSALSLSEDELRQLSNLNAQALRLQRKLAGP